MNHAQNRPSTKGLLDADEEPCPIMNRWSLDSINLLDHLEMEQPTRNSNGILRRKPDGELAQELPASSKHSRRPQVDGGKKPVPSFLGQQTIITVVLKNGDTTETVPIHKSFICYYSPYFNATFNGNFAEGDTQCVELEDAPPVAFNLFVKWLYTQDIAEEEMDLLNGDNTNLVDAWILADRFIVPRLQNQLLWSMSSRRGKVSFESCIRAYEKTAPGSKLRSYIIDRTIYDITTEPDHRPIGEGFSKMFPREMLDDLFYGFLVRYQQRPDSQAIQQNITK